ncbi:hypothetical protein [Andreprevotia chitinilytica]|uniref:hypothetical protein n=1 Tax=Andreprevotia chitinilytica TaxID=396808 RepID=UPI00068AE093|nr:hypothetical protein [Andreprevotia chitinilytica]
MTFEPSSEHDFFGGLQALAASAFPKECRTCGRVYATAEAFLQETRPISSDSSGLKQSEDDNGEYIVEAFRNCVCGSTLMDVFADRRAPDDADHPRRQLFGELLEYLVAKRIERAVARQELLKVMHGEHSDLLAQLWSDKLAERIKSQGMAGR